MHTQNESEFPQLGVAISIRDIACLSVAIHRNQVALSLPQGTIQEIGPESSVLNGRLRIHIPLASWNAATARALML